MVYGVYGCFAREHVGLLKALQNVYLHHTA